MIISGGGESDPPLLNVLLPQGSLASFYIEQLLGQLHRQRKTTTPTSERHQPTNNSPPEVAAPHPATPAVCLAKRFRVSLLKRRACVRASDREKGKLLRGLLSELGEAITPRLRLVVFCRGLVYFLFVIITAYRALSPYVHRSSLV